MEAWVFADQGAFDDEDVFFGKQAFGTLQNIQLVAVGVDLDQQRRACAVVRGHLPEGDDPAVGLALLLRGHLMLATKVREKEIVLHHQRSASADRPRGGQKIDGIGQLGAGRFHRLLPMGGGFDKDVPGIGKQTVQFRSPLADTHIDHRRGSVSALNERL